MVKRYLMIQLWRIQQSYTLLSLFLWGAVLTFTAYPIIKEPWLRFLEGSFGIRAEAPGVVAGTLFLIFFLIYFTLFIFGLVYDKYLRLWREQLDVSVERNPYAREKLMVKEILQWRHMFLPAMRTLAARDEGVRRDIAFMENWIARTVSSDPHIKAALEETEQEIAAGAAKAPQIPS